LAIYRALAVYPPVEYKVLRADPEAGIADRIAAVYSVDV
jgi:hypothetical protein